MIRCDLILTVRHVFAVALLSSLTALFVPGGTAQALSGTPPLEIVIGNAADVDVSYKGQPVDLVPYTRQNVARLTLP